LSKNQRNQLEKRIKTIETELPVLEAETVRLTAEMSQSDVSADYARLTDVGDKLAKAEAEIKELYGEWEQATQDLA